MCVCNAYTVILTFLTWQLTIALPLPVHEFPSSLMASCCYKLLENPAVTRDRAVREKVFHLMGMVIKKYNQALSMLSTVQYTTVYHSKLHSTLQYTTVNCMHTTVYQKFHGTLMYNTVYINYYMAYLQYSMENCMAHYSIPQEIAW